MLSIILSRRDFRESDQIISLFTKDQGKLELLARGVKKITSKNSAHLEPFSLVDIVVEKGKEIDHLTKVQPVEFFSSVRKNAEKSLAASYLVSVVDKLTHTGEREERIFDLLKSWLEFIASVETHCNALVETHCNALVEAHCNAPVLVDGFIIKLLNYLGFAPELKICVVCGIEEIADLYPAGGGVICKVCREKKEKLGERILNCNAEQAKNLLLLLEGDWQLINNLKFKGDEADSLHNLVQEYTVFHSERKIFDWQKFDKRLNS